MSLILGLRDIETGLTVEVSKVYGTNPLYLEWDLKAAVGELTNKVIERVGASNPLEVLMCGPSFVIWAKWEVE